MSLAIQTGLKYLADKLSPMKVLGILLDKKLVVHKHVDANHTPGNYKMEIYMENIDGS